ncbi:hypothetical protein [Alicyclobacillus mengziensis]|uniref:Uncharacterized protein n=1 Tax=Alicyclobacillus mengziensis TaxID=2931921 RepID=A0A9X7Z572_9BACL|nr:hypothetical protein [Alicyclobacillus mengziensis]QSO46052.1 hypothetical protein JZ786_16155 [Alicyclobacillus mengziensis]
MITRSYVEPYIGQRVVVRTHDGVTHHGILHAINNNGMYLRPIRGQAGLAQGTADSSPQLLDHKGSEQGDIEQAWWPFFFLPWLAVAAFWPWGWWW